MLRRVITDKLTDYDALAKQAHLYFDAHIRHINIDSHGEFIRGHTKEGHDNDVDAFRHAYVSALYTARYGESAADLAGQANELIGKNTPEAQSLIRTTVEEFGMFTREQQQNFMMELNGWGIQFDVPTINAYLRDHLLAERFPELPEDGRAHIIDQVRQMEAEEEPFLLYSNDNHQPTNY